MFKNKKEKEKFLKDIWAILKRIQIIIELDYRFTIFFHDKNDNQGAHITNGEAIFAKIETNTYYHTAKLTFFPITIEYWRDKEFFSIISALCHEIAHTITEPIYELFYQAHVSKNEIQKENEYATEKIGRVLNELYFQAHKNHLDKNGNYKKVVHKPRIDKKKKSK